MTGTVPPRLEECANAVSGVAKFMDVFQFQWTSSEWLENRWLKEVKLMKQVSTTLLGDDTCETLTIAGLEEAKKESLEQHLRLLPSQTWGFV